VENIEDEWKKSCKKETKIKDIYSKKKKFNPNTNDLISEIWKECFKTKVPFVNDQITINDFTIPPTDASLGSTNLVSLDSENNSKSGLKSNDISVLPKDDKVNLIPAVINPAPVEINSTPVGISPTPNDNLAPNNQTGLYLYSSQQDEDDFLRNYKEQIKPKPWNSYDLLEILWLAYHTLHDDDFDCIMSLDEMYEEWKKSDKKYDFSEYHHVLPPKSSSLPDHIVHFLNFFLECYKIIEDGES
jgi:hypothetical protein